MSGEKLSYDSSRSFCCLIFGALFGEKNLIMLLTFGSLHQ